MSSSSPVLPMNSMGSKYPFSCHVWPGRISHSKIIQRCELILHGRDLEKFYSWCFFMKWGFPQLRADEVFLTKVSQTRVCTSLFMPAECRLCKICCHQRYLSEGDACMNDRNPWGDVNYVDMGVFLCSVLLWHLKIYSLEFLMKLRAVGEILLNFRVILGL